MINGGAELVYNIATFDALTQMHETPFSISNMIDILVIIYKHIAFSIIGDDLLIGMAWN